MTSNESWDCCLNYLVANKPNLCTALDPNMLVLWDNRCFIVLQAVMKALVFIATTVYDEFSRAY